MATVAQQRQPTSAHARPHHEASRSVSSSSSATMANAQQAPAPAPAPAPAKKGKGKKAADPTEQQKQIQAKIAQLELDEAGGREQELEIGACASLHHVSAWEWPSAGLPRHTALDAVV